MRVQYPHGRRRLSLTLLLTLILLVAFSGVTFAQQGTINIGPGSGPPGTQVQIYNSDPQFAGQCFVNNAYIGDVAALGTLFVSITDPAGSQIPIGCRYEFEGPLTFSITFVVTSPDGDGDGVPDGADQCPNEFAQTQNGCPQQNPDTDGDGIPDNQDACPNQFFQGGNGCPPPGDADSDGIPDNQDACPNQFFQGGNGCPPAGDTDGDGIADPQDACPQQFFQGGNGCPPATLPAQATSAPQATQAPLPQLPSTGACVLATAGAGPVNVRADRSTDSAIVTQLDPLQVYTPTQFVDGWYFIAAIGGWVRADVVRTGGENCQNLGGAVPAEPTPAPGNTLPDYVIPVAPDLGAAFAGCPDLGAQAGRLPLGQVLRLINSLDPCGGIQDVLRDVAFGGPRPPVPQPITQALSSTARCSTDPRPVPSPKLLAILDALNQIDPALATQLNLAIAATVGSEPGSEGDLFLCALMRGDIFVALIDNSFLSFENLNAKLTFVTAVCVPPLDPAYVPARVNYILDTVYPPGEVRDPNAPDPLSFLFAGIATSSNPLSERIELWCGFLQTLGRSLDELPPEQSAAIRWLMECGILTEDRLARFIRELNTADIRYHTVLGGYFGFTWDDFIAFYGSYSEGTCPQPSDLIALGMDIGRRFRDTTIITETSAEVVPLDVDYNLGGFVYEVICNTVGGSTVVAPPGCEITEFRVPVPRQQNNRNNPFGGSLPSLPGGNGGLPQFDSTVVRRLVPNTNRDPFERGIAGVQVQIDSGRCGEMGGERITVVTTDENGYYFVGGLEDGPYCTIIGAELNADLLGTGQWWTPLSVGSGGNMLLNTFASSEYNILPIAQFGWFREGSEGSGPGSFTFIPDFSDMVIDFPPDELLPTAPPGSDSIPGLNPTETVLQEISMVVFEDRCDNTGYAGDPRRMPPNCTNFYRDTLTADGTQSSDEPGIPGVQIELLEGTCETGISIGSIPSDASGRADANIMLMPGQEYCWSVRANSAVNAPILTRGGWTMVSGPRITYRMTAPTATRSWNISFAWWPQAPDVVSGGGSLFDIPELIPDIELTLGPPIPTDVPFTPPTGTPLPSYNVNFVALVWADVCDRASWNGDFRRIPAGCITIAPTTLDSNGIVDDGETRLANVQISIKLGSCDSGEAVEAFMTTGVTGEANSNLTLRAGTYCVLVNPTAGPNAAALGAGQWRGGLGREARTEITIPYFRPTVVLNFPWQPLGTTVAEAPPGIFGPMPGPGLAPALPASASPICPPGCTPAPLPPPRLPTPLPGTNADGGPNALVQLQQQAAAAGINLANFQGDTDGLGVFLGRRTPEASPGLYIYDDGEIFNLAFGDGLSVTGASLSPEGDRIAFISRDGNGRGTLYVMGVENGFYSPVFTEVEGTRLEDEAPVWTGDGAQLLFVLFDVLPEGDVPTIYSLDTTDAAAVPELALADASDPTTTDDEALLAFVRGGNIFIQFAGEATPRPITNQPAGSRCDSPFFDVDGINLYFICRTETESSLLVQGFDGLQPIVTGLPNLTSARPGPAEGTVTLEDGRAVYLAALDGSNLKPLIDLSDLQVEGMRWAQ